MRLVRGSIVLLFVFRGAAVALADEGHQHLAGEKAELAGERQKARARYAELQSLTVHGDGSRAALASARACLARKD